MKIATNLRKASRKAKQPKIRAFGLSGLIGVLFYILWFRVILGSFSALRVSENHIFKTLLQLWCFPTKPCVKPLCDSLNLEIIKLKSDWYFNTVANREMKRGIICRTSNRKAKRRAIWASGGKYFTYMGYFSPLTVQEHLDFNRSVCLKMACNS